MERKTLYMCDPEKNTECKKQSCKYNPAAVYPICDRTTNPAYALLDEANQPMEAPEKSAFQAMRELDQAGRQNGPACT